jgi:hypothetical protein
MIGGIRSFQAWCRLLLLMKEPDRVYCVERFRGGRKMPHRKSHPGVIRFANGSRVLECTVRNSSASWAELRADGVGVVPQRFELQERPDAPRRAATVVWRKPGALGVKFDEYFLLG